MASSNLMLVKDILSDILSNILSHSQVSDASVGGGKITKKKNNNKKKCFFLPGAEKVGVKICPRRDSVGANNMEYYSTTHYLVKLLRREYCKVQIFTLEKNKKQKQSSTNWLHFRSQNLRLMMEGANGDLFTSKGKQITSLC